MIKPQSTEKSELNANKTQKKYSKLDNNIKELVSTFTTIVLSALSLTTVP